MADFQWCTCGKRQYDAATSTSCGNRWCKRTASNQPLESILQGRTDEPIENPWRPPWDWSERAKKRARRAVFDALRSGNLAPTAACEWCENALAIEAHHPDYGHHLYVFWLCIKCHRSAHKVIDRLRAGEL